MKTATQDCSRRNRARAFPTLGDGLAPSVARGGDVAGLGPAPGAIRTSAFPALTWGLPLLVAAALLALALFVSSSWLTNDDVGMSMRAHGYGAQIQPTPTLLFSNVLWGECVSHLPSLFGILGYSVGTYLVLLLSAALTVRHLVRLAVSPWLAGPVVLGVFALPFTTPQFTLCSGLLALPSLLAFRRYQLERSPWLLLQALALFFWACLIRWNQPLLTALIASPLILTRAGLRDRRLWAGALALVMALSLATWLDARSRQGPAWAKYNRFKPLQVSLTDYGWTDRIIASSPESARDLSDNDLRLLRTWFFVDEALTNAATLQRFSGSARARVGLGAIRDLPATLKTHVLDPFVRAPVGLLSGLLLLVFIARFSARSGATIALTCAVAWYFGGVGRAFPMRVAYPVVADLFLLLLATGVCLRSLPRPLVRLQHVALTVLTVGLVVQAVQRGVARKALARDVEQDAAALPAEVLVTWGAYFPYEALYRPFDRRVHLQHLALYSFSSATYVPGSRAHSLESGPRPWFVSQLLSDHGVLFVGYKGHVLPEGGALLSQYCQERHGRKMEAVETLPLRALEVTRIRCAASIAGQ